MPTESKENSVKHSYMSELDRSLGRFYIRLNEAVSSDVRCVESRSKVLYTIIILLIPQACFPRTRHFKKELRCHLVDFAMWSESQGAMPCPLPQTIPWTNSILVMRTFLIGKIILFFTNRIPL